MHKVGIMVMGKMKESPKKVKQIILQVQGKTKMTNLIDYLMQLGKIPDRNVQFSLQKNGRPVSQSSNITQTLKYTTPINGVIKLYMYQKGQFLNVTVSGLKQPQSPKKQNQPPKSTTILQPKPQIKQIQPSGCCCC